MLTYRKDLPWQEFARLSIQTLDLDPVYVALAESGWSEEKLLRWCTAFTTYYHTGTACEVCDLEGDTFWTALWDRYDTNPRAAERRHFRGEAGRKALVAWRNTYGTPEKFALACMQSSFMKILNAGIPQVGQYFSWKWADFREAVFGYSMDWTEAEKHLVGLPQSGLKYLFPQERPESSIWRVVEAIGQTGAPPRFTRYCGLAEAETIACMLKAYYLNGKPIGKDIVERREQLLEATHHPNAIHLLHCFPKEPMDADVEVTA